MACAMLHMILACSLANLALGVPEFAITRRVPSGHQRALHARAIDTNVFNAPAWVNVEYFTNITVGTPPQLITVVMDVDNAGTFIIGDSATCSQTSTNSSAECVGGLFRSVDSSSYQQINEPSSITSIWSNIITLSGTLAADAIGVGNVSLPDFNFVLASNASTAGGVAYGVLGLGYSTFQYSAVSKRYPTIVDIMVSTEQIGSRLFSMYLGSADAGSGSLLFGAIDTTKYSGQLSSLNFLPGYGGEGPFYNISAPIVAITAAEAKISGGTFPVWSGGSDGLAAWTDESSVPVVLTPAYDTLTLPPALFDSLVSKFPYVNATGAANGSTPTCSCDDVSPGDTITFTFGTDAQITFDVSQFVIPAFYQDNTPIKFDNGSQACYLQILIANEAPYAFGASFLRNMYTVFDLDNGQAAVAQAVLDGTYTPNIIEVPAGAGGLAKVAPSVITASSNTWPVQSGILWTGSYDSSSVATPIGTATGLDAVPTAAQILGIERSFTITPGTSYTPALLSTAQATASSIGGNSNAPTANSSSSSSDHTGAIAGGVVGGIAGLALIGAAVWFTLRRRARRNASNRQYVPEMM